MSETLPRGWVTTKMEAILATLDDGRLLSQGWSPRCHSESAQSEQDWAVLKTTAIQDGYFIPEENKKLPAEMTPRPNLEVRPGDLLITCAGPRRRCGIVCLVEATRGRLMISGKMYRFRVPERHVSSRYIAYFLRCGVTQEAIDGLKTGMSDSGLNLTHERFLGLPVLLAPFPEQRRIVAKIDSLSAKSRRARDHLDHIPRLVEKYKQAILAAAFRGELTREWRQQHRVGGQWSTRSLEELIDEGPTNGWSPKSGADASGAFTLKLTATTSGTLRLDHAAVKRIYEVPPPTSPYWLEPGDLLVQRSNTIEYVGAAAIFDGPCRTYIYPDLMMRIRIKDETNRLYVWRFLNSDEARRYFRERATGTAGNMPKINGGTLRSLPVPLPSTVGERQQIVRRIDTAFTWIDRLAADATSARKLIDHLDQAILAKAFRGELVPQDPNDEPASVLLERIRAERQSAARQRGSARRTSRSRIRLKE